MLELGDPWDALASGLLLTAIAVLWTIVHVRLVGLRAFSKMTSFDFVTTVATGSLIAQAGTRSDWMSYLRCLAAISGVFLIQYVLARLRLNFSAVERLVTNRPVLLMEDGRFLDEAMSANRVSRESVLEKLRESNVNDLSEVRAVVLETTGDISVLHGEHLDSRIMGSVERPAAATPG